MTSLKNVAEAYQPKTTKNVTELEEVSTNVDIEVREFQDQEGKSFKINVALIDGEEYRVPTSVISQLKTQLEERPAMSLFKVRKKGTGMQTEYTVVPLN